LMVQDCPAAIVPCSASAHASDVRVDRMLHPFFLSVSIQACIFVPSYWTVPLAIASSMSEVLCWICFVRYPTHEFPPSSVSKSDP
jgi:hypothetical protein